MARLSDKAIAQLLYNHGLRSVALITGIEIVLAESGGNTQAVHHNLNGSTDRGLWQFNDRAHPEVPDGCAFNPDCSTTHAVTFAPGFAPWAGDRLRRIEFSIRAEKAAAQVEPGQPGGPGCSAPCGPLNVAQQAAITLGLQGYRYGQHDPNQDPAIRAAVAGCVKAGGSQKDCEACAECKAGEMATQQATGGCGECVHCFNGPFGISVCLDTILGGIKVAAGGFVVLVAGLAILYLLGRDLLGGAGGQAYRAVRTATPVRYLPKKRPTSGSRPSRGRSDLSPAQRTRVAIAREARKADRSAARTKAFERLAADRNRTRRERYRERAADSRATIEIARTERAVRADEGGYRIVGGKRVYRRD